MDRSPPGRERGQQAVLGLLRPVFARQPTPPIFVIADCKAARALIGETRFVDRRKPVAHHEAELAPRRRRRIGRRRNAKVAASSSAFEIFVAMNHSVHALR